MPGLTTTRRFWLVAVSLLLVGAGAAWWFWGWGGTVDDAAAPAEGAPDDPSVVGGEEDPLTPLLPDALTFEEDAAAARSAADALAEITSDADVDGRLSEGTRAAVEGVDGALPTGTVLTPREETWARRGNIAGMLVEVEPPGADTPDVFLVWLVRDPEDEGGWLLSATELLDGQLDEGGPRGDG